MYSKFVCIGAVVLAVGSSSAAEAQDRWSVHGQGTILSGWTNNINYAPTDVPGVAGPSSDLFFDFRPGALLTRAAPLSIQSLTYEFQANINVNNPSGNDTAHRLELRSFHRLGPTSEMTINVAGSFGSSGNIIVQNGADQTLPNFVPDPDQTFQRLQAFEVYRWRPTESSRADQGLSASRVETFIDGESVITTQTARLNGGWDKAWNRSSLGVGLSTEFIQLDTPGDAVPQARLLENTAQLRLRHDFNLRWSGAALAGLARVTPITEGAGTWQPVAQLSAFYRNEIGSASLSFTREIVPILFAAQNSISESTQLRTAIPLPFLTPDPTRPRLYYSMGAGINKTQIIDSNTGELSSGWTMAIADIALSYVLASPRFNLGLRYQYQERVADEAQLTITSYTRHTFMFTIAGRFPERPAGVIPSRDGVRVDEGDNEATTDESEAAAAADSN